MNAHPLVARLVQAHDARVVDLATLDAWLASGGVQVLFFGGDPVRFPESLDVAVVLPELRGALPERFAIGVAQRDDEDALARRFGVRRWPSLVFLRDGLYVATVEGMKDWDDYLRASAVALAAAPSRAPGIGIPLVAAGASDACH